MVSKNKWFKHYNSASQGATLRSLWDAGDYEAYGLFWQLLELVSRFEDHEERGKITISWSVISRETGWKPSKCVRVLSRICSVSKIEMEEKPEGNVSFLVPNWLELQENRGGKRLPKKVQSLTDVRCKIEDERCKIKEKEKEKVRVWKTSKSDLENVYELYPRKEGKSEGFKKAEAQIKTPEDLENLKRAVMIYREKADPAYLKHFSTFMTSWRDCLDPDYGERPVIKKLANEKISWTEQAEKALLLAKKNGFSFNDRAKEELGPWLSNLVKSIGGFRSIGDMRDDDFRTGKIAAKLKAAHEILSNPTNTKEFSDGQSITSDDRHSDDQEFADYA